MADKTKLPAAYIPFRTLLTALDYLHDHGVPNVIDKTVFPKVATVVQGQLISALKFLDLIADDGLPSQELKNLAVNSDSRAATLRPVLEAAYADLFAGNLAGMSPSQFDNLFTAEAYSVNGDTMKKAKAFFLKAAEFAKVPLSSHLTRRSRASSPRKKRQAKSNGGGASQIVKDAGAEQHHQTPPATGETKILKLNSGATLSLSLDVSFMGLPKADRDFVSKLVDSIDTYESPNASVSGGEVRE